jgi:hypothetical protein
MIPGTPTPEHQVFRLGIQNAGNPEIAQSGSAGSVQKNIAALEIPMDHSLTVGVLERLGQRPQTREDLLRCPSSKLGDVAAFHMLHGNEDGGWIFMKIKDPDNVRMGQSPGVTAFLPQEGNLFRGGTWGHDLGDHLGAQTLVSSHPHLSHATPAKGANQGKSRGQGLTACELRHGLERQRD